MSGIHCLAVSVCFWRLSHGRLTTIKVIFWIKIEDILKPPTIHLQTYDIIYIHMLLLLLVLLLLIISSSISSSIIIYIYMFIYYYSH